MWPSPFHTALLDRLYDVYSTLILDHANDRKLLDQIEPRYQEFVRLINRDANRDEPAYIAQKIADALADAITERQRRNTWPEGLNPATVTLENFPWTKPGEALHCFDNSDIQFVKINPTDKTALPENQVDSKALQSTQSKIIFFSGSWGYVTGTHNRFKKRGTNELIDYFEFADTYLATQARHFEKLAPPGADIIAGIPAAMSMEELMLAKFAMVENQEWCHPLLRQGAEQLFFPKFLDDTGAVLEENEIYRRFSGTVLAGYSQGGPLFLQSLNYVRQTMREKLQTRHSPEAAEEIIRQAFSRMLLVCLGPNSDLEAYADIPKIIALSPNDIVVNDFHGMGVNNPINLNSSIRRSTRAWEGIDDATLEHMLLGEWNEIVHSETPLWIDEHTLQFNRAQPGIIMFDPEGNRIDEFDATRNGHNIEPYADSFAKNPNIRQMIAAVAAESARTAAAVAEDPKYVPPPVDFHALFPEVHQVPLREIFSSVIGLTQAVKDFAGIDRTHPGNAFDRLQHIDPETAWEETSSAAEHRGNDQSVWSIYHYAILFPVLAHISTAELPDLQNITFPIEEAAGNNAGTGYVRHLKALLDHRREVRALGDNPLAAIRARLEALPDSPALLSEEDSKLLSRDRNGMWERLYKAHYYPDKSPVPMERLENYFAVQVNACPVTLPENGENPAEIPADQLLKYILWFRQKNVVGVVAPGPNRVDNTSNAIMNLLDALGMPEGIPQNMAELPSFEALHADKDFLRRLGRMAMLMDAMGTGTVPDDDADPLGMHGETLIRTAKAIWSDAEREAAWGSRDGYRVRAHNRAWESTPSTEGRPPIPGVRQDMAAWLTATALQLTDRHEKPALADQLHHAAETILNAPTRYEAEQQWNDQMAFLQREFVVASAR